jgi:hypothetical protein
MIIGRRRLLTFLGGRFGNRMGMPRLVGLSFLHGIEFATQRFYFTANLGQTSLNRHDLHLIALRSRRAAKINLIASQIFHHSGLSTDNGVIAQSNVIR